MKSSAATPSTTESRAREEFEDYTGNAGLTLERWYHRGAIVIWPRERHFAVLCGAGTQAAIGGLEAMVKGPRRGSKEQREATRRDAMQFAGAIIDGWTPPRASWIGDTDAKVDRSLFSKLLCKLDDPGLLRRFLSEIVPNDGSAEIHREFAKVCGRHGLRSFETELAQAIAAASEATLLRNAKLLHLLCRQPDHDKRDAAVCTRLCASAVAALERFDGQAPKDAWGFRTLDRTALLVTLVSAMLEIGAKRPLRKLFDHTLAHPELYDLTDTHLAAIFKLEPSLGTLSPPGRAITHWLSACRRELRMRTAQAPQAPKDYRRDAELSCKCADCRVLGRFLASPSERECRMPLNKDRRRHLHGIIEADRCDVTHVTERKGPAVHAGLHEDHGVVREGLQDVRAGQAQSLAACADRGRARLAARSSSYRQHAYGGVPTMVRGVRVDWPDDEGCDGSTSAMTRAACTRHTSRGYVASCTCGAPPDSRATWISPAFGCIRCEASTKAIGAWPCRGTGASSSASRPVRR